MNWIKKKIEQILIKKMGCRCRANNDVDEIVEPFLKIAIVSLNLLVFVSIILLILKYLNT